MSKIAARNLLVVVLIVALGQGWAWATATTVVMHNTEAQFKQGEPNAILISSEGELTLGYEVQSLLKDSNDIWVVNDVVKAPTGELYVATSPKGRVYRIAPSGAVEVIYGATEGDQPHVFCLAFDPQGRLLLGTGGEKGLVLRRQAEGHFETLFCDPEIHYIWDVLFDAAGRMYLATGPTGKVFQLDAQGQNPQVFYQAKDKNILVMTLAPDASVLFAGGDENGLVYRIDLQTRQATIAYDTGHSEISALAFDKNGCLYMATGDAGAANVRGKLILGDGGVSGHISPTAPAISGSDDDEEEDESSEETPDDVKKAVGSSSDASAMQQAPGPPGPPPADKPGKKPVGPLGPGGPMPGMMPGGPSGSSENNEIFKLTPEGFISKVFSQPVVILDMIYDGDHELFIATGNEGRLLGLNLDRREAVEMYQAKPSAQVSALWASSEEVIYAGCANAAQVLAITPVRAQKGIYQSAVIDADQVTQWGHVSLEADIPDGAQVQWLSRTGNTKDPDKGGWQEWTAPQPITNAADVTMMSPPGRFLQYRLILTSSVSSATPVVKRVRLTHRVPNLPPEVTRVAVEPPGAKGPMVGPMMAGKRSERVDKGMNISWEATDANKDKLTYEVYLRLVGLDRWVRLAKDLTDSNWKWDSLTVADGRYELMVKASDLAANPLGEEQTDQRISKAFLVDNTPPVVDTLLVKRQGDLMDICLEVRDEFSAISQISYCLNSAEKWHLVNAVDGMFDTLVEQTRFSVTVEDTEPQWLSLRVEDEVGNVVYRNVTIPAP